MVWPGGRSVIVSAVALLACTRAAQGATLSLDAPDGCVDPATLEQEVADLVGRPLAEVREADFRLTIAPQTSGRWHLKLEATEHGSAPNVGHVRELDAPSCSELGEAAALAIAVSIRGLASAAPPPPDQLPPPAPPPDPPTVVTAMAAPAPAPAPPPWRPALTVAVASDAGEVPSTGATVMAGAAVRRRSLRLAAAFGWVPSRDILPDGAIGGRFQLAFAAADGCFAPGWGAWAVRACLGGELGAYRATGEGVGRPASRTSLWRAGRASLGAALSVSSAVAVVLDGTAVVPWSRPWFVVNGSRRIYRPEAAAIRLGAGLEFPF